MDKENQHKKVSNVKKSSKKHIHKSPTKTKNSASQSQNSIVGQILKDIQKTFKFKIDAKTIKMNIACKHNSFDTIKLIRIPDIHKALCKL